jgi:CubicO group peptidase (beta-lactamase class C family)
VQNFLDVELAGRLKIRTRSAELRNRLSIVVGKHAHRPRAAGVDSEQTHSGEAYLIAGLFWYAGGVLAPRDPRFDAATAVITEGLSTRAFPAASVDVGTASGSVWQQAFGRLTYDDAAPPASIDTIFDLASLTKVIATTSIAMHQVAAGLISLGTRVREILPSCGQSPVGAIEIRQLLDHSSGLPAHLRLFERASGRDAFCTAICAASPEREPGTASVYSDPGFMLLGFVLETSGGGPLDKQFNDLRDRGDRDEPLLYCTPAALLDRIAPTEFDKWRGRLLRGEVHDENTAALGGVAAHAGLFGTAKAVGDFARMILRTFKEPTPLGTPDAMKRFASRSGVPGSSRALGWDTALPTSSSGTRMSARAIGHTGFTGTSLWIDPERDMYAVLLTNRVHPTRENEKLLPLRGRFHDALPF